MVGGSSSAFFGGANDSLVSPGTIGVCVCVCVYIYMRARSLSSSLTFPARRLVFSHLSRSASHGSERRYLALARRASACAAAAALWLLPRCPPVRIVERKRGEEIESLL